MKLSIVLLALVSAYSNECDITSHLATRTHTTQMRHGNPAILISEFEPWRFGPLEISGPPGASFGGCSWLMDAVGNVLGAAEVVDTFRDDGLIATVLNIYQTPPTSVIFFLSENCPPEGVNEPSAIILAVREIYDAIGVPITTSDESIMQETRNALAAAYSGTFPGKDFKSPNAESQLVFRDASVGELYLTRTTSGPVLDVKGVTVDAQSFNKDPLVPTFGAINPSRVGAVIGDPHIQTLSGDHYTLLREGSFLLWQLAMEKVHWQIYAHYAGRQSFTKGLLLVDTSGPQPSSMEITSEDCQWQTSSKSTGWSPITSDNEVLLSGPSSRMKLVDHKHEDIQQVAQVELFLSDEKNPVVRLKVMCRPGRHINLKLDMTNKKWASFVTGELIGEKYRNRTSETRMSTLQLVVKDDQEFEVKKLWKELGGSTQAQQYLENLEQPIQNVGLIQTCDQKAEVEARVICQKHLGTHVSWDSAYFKDCVFDVCSGAGEAAEEMAAMLKP